MSFQLIHDQEVKDLTKRMDAESKEQMRQLQKKHKDKQAINRYSKTYKILILSWRHLIFIDI